MLTAQHISTSLYPILPGMNVQQALDLMEDQGVSSLAVADDDQFYGVARQSVLFDYDNLTALLSDLPEHMLPKLFLQAHQHELEIIAMLSEFKLDTVAILNEEQQYQGSIRALEFIQNLGQQFNLIGSGGILVLEVLPQNYHLSEIAQIVESGDARILSLFISNAPQNNHIYVTLRCDRDDLDPVVQTFTRYGYEVVASFYHSKYKTDLNKRYDLLMRYINI